MIPMTAQFKWRLLPSCASATAPGLARSQFTATWCVYSVLFLVNNAYRAQTELRGSASLLSTPCYGQLWRWEPSGRGTKSPTAPFRQRRRTGRTLRRALFLRGKAPEQGRQFNPSPAPAPAFLSRKPGRSLNAWGSRLQPPSRS
ncbi:hypothetical protein NDU88_006784 [Pleurodeles waltl]|uniref:Uncharacterized protein n=1 Tax=Pleurodeles waltl TaxID=8319 RepID=A0AAV7PS96_PLEWA|nr:hypothetical protein NDU88_006784 [Pleurodeles waltl]